MSIPQHCVDDTADVMQEIEECADKLLVLGGKLFAKLVDAQTEGRLHPLVMHESIFSKLPNLISSATETRGAALDVHRGMNVIAKRFDLARTVHAGGPLDKDLPWPMTAVSQPAAEQIAQRPRLISG